MTAKIFDTHAHYDDESFDSDREELLKRLLSEDIAAITNIGADIETSKKAVELSKLFDKLYAAVGVHPDLISCFDEYKSEDEAINEIKKLADNHSVKAIGEIGLDYYERSENEKPEEVRKRQGFWFRKQLRLAKELELPVVIHSRDAAEDTYRILKEEMPCGGVIHCYAYSAEMAEKFVKLGFFIGIGGVVTFKNAKKAVEVVKKIGLDHIVLETDAPYLSPVPFRGKRNDSANIHYVAEKISEILSCTKEEVLEKSFKNALKLYRLKEV